MWHALREYASGIASFFKLVRSGRIKEIDRLLDAGKLAGVFQVTKFASRADLIARRPYAVGAPSPNILVNVGMAAMWNLVTAQGGTAFSNANGFLGVGDSSAAPAVGQTDLQAATNKLRKAMDGSFPNAPANGVEQWRATFASGDANYSWNEFAMFNASSGGTMLNRSVSSQGTKASGQSWQCTYTITLS